MVASSPHLDVPGERGAVGEDHAVAHLAVVRDVGVGHEQVVVADAGDAAALGGAAVDGARTRGSGCGRRSRAGSPRRANFRSCGSKPMQACGKMRFSRPMRRRAVDLRAGADLGAVADLDAGADHRERADRDSARRARAPGSTTARRMDRRRRHRPRSARPPSPTRAPPRPPARRRPGPCRASLQKAARRRSTSTS